MLSHQRKFQLGSMMSTSGAMVSPLPVRKLVLLDRTVNPLAEVAQHEATPSTPTLQRYNKFNKSTRFGVPPNNGTPNRVPFADLQTKNHSVSTSMDSTTVLDKTKKSADSTTVTANGHVTIIPVEEKVFTAAPETRTITALTTRKDNWLLLDKGPELRCAAISSSSIILTDTDDEVKCDKQLNSLKHGTWSGIVPNRIAKQVTNGSLKLVKTQSLNLHALSTRDADIKATPSRKDEPCIKRLLYKHDPLSHSAEDLRKAQATRGRSSKGNSHPIDRHRVRKSLFEVFPENACCHCCAKGGLVPEHKPKETNLNNAAVHGNPEIKVSPPPSVLSATFSTSSGEDGAIARTVSVNTLDTLDMCRTSPTDSEISLAGPFQFEVQYQSCPDLLQPLLGKDRRLDLKTDSPSQSTFKKAHRRRKTRNSSENSWFEKPLKEWKLDDILVWLQSLGLDDVASIIVGYELTGADIELWNDRSINELPINSQSQEVLLKELRKLKLQRYPSRVKKWSKSNPSCLYSLLQQQESNTSPQILPVQLPAAFKCQQLSVAEGATGGLTVTKITGHNVGLEVGDCIVEINEECTIHMPAVDFNKRLAATSGPHRLVLIRNLHDNEKSPVTEKSRLNYSPACLDVRLLNASNIKMDDDQFGVMHF